MGKKEIIVYLKYKGTDFFGRKELFQGGTIVWASHTVLFLIGENDPKWDEIIVVSFTEENSYSNALDQLAKEQRLKNYKILLVSRYPQAAIDRVNKMSYKESSVDITKGDNIEVNEEPGGIGLNRMQYELLLQRDKNTPIVLLNIVKYHDIAKYPESYDGKKNITGKEAYKLYGLNSAKIQGMPMVNVTMDLAGENLATIVGNNEPDWEHYFFARYPSLEHLLNMWTSKVYQQGVIHRTAALEKSYVWAITPYEDF
jgi:hypothetical protein